MTFWEPVILDYLRNRRGQAVKLWTMIEDIGTANSGFKRYSTHPHHVEIKRELNATLAQLVREKKVIRYRNPWRFRISEKVFQVL